MELVITMDPPCPCSIIVGAHTSTVLNTPVSMTSMESCHAACVKAWSPKEAKIPALATTMSSRPNSARPSFSADSSCPLSRTSTRRATIPRPTSVTRFAVVSRSALSAIL